MKCAGALLFFERNFYFLYFPQGMYHAENRAEIDILCGKRSGKFYNVKIFAVRRLSGVENLLRRA